MILETKKLLPNFFKVIETKHYSKGRLRFKIDLLKDNHEAILYLEENLSKISAISSFKINQQIGSLLLVFNEDEVEPILLSGVIIKILDLETIIESKKDGKLSKLFKEFLDNIDKGIYNKSRGFLDKKTIISGAFLYLAYRQFKVNKNLPNGTNLVWWAYNLITK